MTGVDVDDLSVEFDDVTALGGVSLTVEDGEFFTLVGPSGCGKTTLLRAIAGLEVPTGGTVSIAGRTVTGVPPEDRDIGMVFQSYALFPHMTVEENVAYGLQFRDDVDERSRIAELLDLVDLPDVGDRSPDALSGGQQQRIALARALAPNPDVLLLDEPLSALDAKLRQELRVQIKAIQRELGITTVYVTHDQGEALALSDRVAVLHDGHVEQVATPETVYREPTSPFVAEFVGDNNVFTGRTRGDTVTIDGDSLSLPSTVDRPDGTRITVALRPESIGLTATDTSQAKIEATVETTEFLGDAYRVHCAWNDRSIAVKTDASSRPSGRVTLSYDPVDLQVFQ